MKIPDSPLSQSITSHSSNPTIIKKSDYYTYHSRPCLSYFKKGVFSMQEGHVLKYRKACSQIQKGHFFCLNTHALHSCGAKQIYIKIKYSSPSHAFHSPTHFPSSPNPPPSHPHPTPLPFSAHSPSAPILLPFCPQPVLFPFPAYSPSVRSPLSFRPQPTPRPSPTHSPLSVTPRTCSSVTLSPLAYNLFPVSPSTRQLIMLLLELVHLLPCLLSPPTCSLVSPSTRQLTMLLSELVHLLPCLLIHLTCSLVPLLTRLLVNYFYHLTFLSVLVQNTATLILPFLSPTSTVKNITTSKTSH